MKNDNTLNGPFIVEMNGLPNDIAQIHKGQQIFIKIKDNRSAINSALEGNIKSISQVSYAGHVISGIIEIKKISINETKLISEKGMLTDGEVITQEASALTHVFRKLAGK
ncbi:MAG: hypothetical protein JWQ57_2886 [Mucilaginibacter sp.]|nr:hypothetical protein [Mucilaginibacter sp.]